ncbi:non-ribosomal peptide synthetase [Actinokineospora sp. 24-640]
MSEVLKRLRALTPERRAAFAARIAERGAEFDVHPVSSGQRRLWLLEQLHPGRPAHNVPYAFRLRGGLDVTALAEALRLLGTRHESLRTVFLDLRGEPRQMILPEPPFALETAGGPADPRALADAEARTPFDLATEAPVRARLVRLGADDHLLLVTLHHIVCDGWSTKLLFAELAAAYESLVDGQEPDLGPEPLRYQDFSRWQTEWLAGPAGDELRAHWVAALDGAPPVLELPTDHARPAVLSMAGGIQRFTWPGELAERLAAFARAERVTPFMVLVAAWNVLLHRRTGQTDLVVGTNVANRGREETEGTVGFFVNTLALRTRIDPAAGFRALLAAVRETVLAAQAHQDLPFEAVVDAVRPPRSTAHHPVVQTLVGVEDSESDILTLPGLAVERVESHSGTAKWDLELALTATAGRIAGSLEYDSALYEPATAQALLGNLRTLLTAGIADPERPVDRLPILTDAERERVLRTWNPPTRARQAGRLVHELAEATADRTSDATALVFESGAMTYAELEARANQLAHHLRAAGVGRGSLVGICLPRSLELVVAMQGVLKSGAAYVPLDPVHPAQRIAYMLGDSGARIVLTTPELAGTLPADVPTLFLTEVSGPAHRPQRITEPDDLAYVIYTSGSTGKPKGVMVPHAGVCNLVDELVRLAGITAADRVLQFASFGFDVSVADIMSSLTAGATLVLAARADLQPGPDLARTINDNGVTVAGLPPTVLRLMDPAAVPGLRTVMAGGEACPAEVAARWAPGREFTNIYGPTETSIWVTSTPCDGTENPLPIGHPVAANECHILDAHLEPVPVGVPGELCVGGVGVVRGYLGKPALTADRFVPDPFSGRPGARLYRTGDLARFRADGRIEFLRRMDDQVKVRGYRVELGEVQAAIGACDGVRAAVVVTREDVPGDVRLVAYVVAEDGRAVDAAALRAALRQSLPEYMVPSAFVPVDTIPRNASGKLDRAALPAPEAAAGERALVPAGTPLERAIVEVWREVLRVERIGADDNFFDVGGNSLLLAKTRARLAETLGRDIPAVTLFTFPTVHALAAHFEGADTAIETGRDLATGRRALLARRAASAREA